MQGVILAEKRRSLGPLHCYFTRTPARLRPFVGRLFGHHYARYMHRKCWRGLLPWFHVPSRYAPITAHHLLSHSAGLAYGTDFSPDGRYEVWALRDVEAPYPPGQHYYYSNVGYKVLGLLLEQPTGEPYGTVVQRDILDPLDMTLTEPVITHATRAPCRGLPATLR